MKTVYKDEEKSISHVKGTEYTLTYFASGKTQKINFKEIKLYKGKVTILFYERYHWYFLKKPKEIVRLIGTTTITGTLDKSGAISWWAVRVALERLGYYDANDIRKKIKNPERFEAMIKERHDLLAQTLETIKSLTPEKYYEMLYEAQRVPNQKKSEAAQIGKQAHEFCENWINWKMGTPGFVEPVLPTDPIVYNAVSAFLGLVKEHNITFLASEKIVYSKKYGFVGTMDCKAIIDGKLALVDFKTSNGIYSSFYYQTAAYLMADAEETKDKYDTRWVFRFSKEALEDEVTGEKYVEWEAKEIGIDGLKDDYDAFLGLKKVTEREAQFKKVANANQSE